MEKKIKKIPPRSRDKVRPPKPSKPAREDKGPSWFQVQWKKMGSIFENGFDGVLGEIYDEMGENNEGKQ